MTEYKIIKRDGSVADFNIKKIVGAITKAFEACGRQYHSDVVEMLALHTCADFEKKIKDGRVTVEEIQDSVEKTLSEAGYSDVAKAYILYRRQHEKVRGIGSSLVNYKDIVDNYLKVNDWRVKENSTVTYSVGGLILSNSGAITANYWLSEVYDDEVAEAHRSAAIHLHDLSMLTGYCFTGDTRVKTLDGKNPTFAKLVEDGVKECWVYSYDHKTGQIVPAKAVNPRVTRTTDALVEVELCDGTTIRCTPDHRFMLSDGTYLRADELSDGTSLMTADNESNRVSSTQKVQLEEETDVYDLTVPDYENFVIQGNVVVHNCAGWSLKQLIQEGLGGIPGKITSAPAHHLSTLCNQMVNFLGIMQNEWAG